MEKKSNTRYLLLIRSPFAAVGDISSNWARLQSVLRSASPNVIINDAALDYMEKIVTHGVDCTAMAPSDDIDPMAMIEGMKDLDAALDAATINYPPCLFHRHGFAHPELNQIADLEQFAKDSRANPFHTYALDLWQPFDASTPPAMALLYVETPGQIGPAVTLTIAWQQRWPVIPLQWVGPDVVTNTLSEKFSNLGDQSAPGAQIDPAGMKKIIADFSMNAAFYSASGLAGEGRCDELDRQPLIDEQMPAMVQAALKKKCNFMMWQWQGGEIDAITKQLYIASRQGIWNHLVFDRSSPAGLLDFAAANANIVHSYCHKEDPLSTYSDPVIRLPADSPGYGQTQPMPGRPLWMALGSPASIRALLNHYDAKTLMRLRVREDDQRLFEVGKRLSYAFKPPADLPDGYLGEIVRMVEAGGSVNPQFVRHNLERAYLIAYVEEEGVIVGNSSLKHPREEYIDAVSSQSGIDLHNFLERGYTSVRPEYRGLGVGVKLLEGLTERAGAYKIFSVIAESNIATQKMAIRNRTRKVATFFSHRANKKMSVWIPEWMLPKRIVLPEQTNPESNDSCGKDPS
jgi:GNAT superfamily N-acetyltransferase